MKRILPILFVLVILGSACAPTQPEPTATPSPTPSPSPSRTVAATALPPSATPTRRPPSPTPSPTPIPVTATASLPTSTPGPSPTPLPPPTAAPAPVAVWEDTLTLHTYGWEQGLVPTTPDDPVYPYPRMDFEAVGAPAPRTYRAVFIQNDVVRLAVLPELGGRILRWTDRTTGRQLFYANPVVKPTRWGMRGWWLATGGMEWAFPTEEHGLNEYRPWQHELLWNGVRVWDTEDRTGMTIEVTVQLEAGSSRIAVTPRVTNPTGEPHEYQLWTNGMLALSDANTPSPGLTFILPAGEVIVHSTGDGSLPGPGGVMDWPVHGGRDFSRYTEHRAWLGVFAPQAAGAGFSGAYDTSTDQGIVRVAPTWVRGVKLFCMGDLGSELWTDDSSRYFELWGGLTSSFWENATIAPGESVGWTEYWYAVSGMGTYTWANGEGAVRLVPGAEGVEVGVQTVRPHAATVVLRRDGVEVERWEAETGPAQPFRATYTPGGAGEWGLEVHDASGAVLIQVGP